MSRRKQPVIPDAIFDQLLGGADPKTAFAKDGLLDELKKALAERLEKFRAATCATLTPGDAAAFETAFAALSQGKLGPVRQVLARKAEPVQ